MIAEKINQIREVRKQQQAISKREKELTRPLLMDLDLIPTLYQWFCEILNGMDCPPLVESVTQRKKFLFIILFLYSPGALDGKLMVRGLRDQLAKVLNITSRSTISDNCADVVEFYNSFEVYRDEIDTIYQEIFRRVLLKGWLVFSGQKSAISDQ